MKGVELCEWLTKNLEEESKDNILIFDRIEKIKDKIKFFLEEKKLKLSIDDDVFLMKLILLIYNSSI